MQHSTAVGDTKKENNTRVGGGQPPKREAIDRQERQNTPDDTYSLKV